MKAITAVCATGASVPAISTGRVSRHRDGENAEIQMYLSKLKDLVPFMPKNRKLSKLEVILNVIDYICDLQSTLESHPTVNNFDAQSVLNGFQQQNQQIINTNTLSLTTSSSPRQPLGVRSSPNTILNSNHSLNTHNSISSNLISENSQSSQNLMTTEKINSSNSIIDHHRSQC